MSKTPIAFSFVIALALGVAAVMALTGGMTGCEKKTASEQVLDAGKSAGNAVGDAAKATGNAVGDAAKATGSAVGDATEATGEFLMQSKDASVKVAQDTLNGIEKKWHDLQAKAEPATDEAKADFQKVKDQMAQTLADAKAKLVEAEDATADVWQQNVQPALEASLQKAQKLYEDTAAKFSTQ